MRLTMGIVPHKQYQTRDDVSPIVVRSSAPRQAMRHLHPLLRLPRTIGNRAVQRVLEAESEERHAKVTSVTSLRRLHLLLGPPLFDGKTRGGDKMPDSKKPEKKTAPDQPSDRGPCD